MIRPTARFAVAHRPVLMIANSGTAASHPATIQRPRWLA
jgi:hypothetical protein